MIKVALCAAHAVREVNGRGAMSESALFMRRLSGASTAAAAMREGALAPSATGKEAAMRVGGINARITDDKVLQLVFRALNWDPAFAVRGGASEPAPAHRRGAGAVA
jgi:hypothetical protein